MKIVKSLGELAAHGVAEAVVACGVFDGVHRGHQRVLSAMLDYCRQSGATPVVLTFEPHPRTVLKPSSPPPRLTLPEQKLQCLARYGAEAAIVVDFTPSVAAMRPEEFLQTYLLQKRVDLQALCVGADWRFGQQGSGDVQQLTALGAVRGFKVIAVEEVWLDGLEVGSTEIRHALARGDLPMAAAHLGRDYAVVGVVGRGKGLGGDVFDCPTANIIPAGQMLPADGVYAVAGHVDVCHSLVDGFDERAERPGIAYVGTCPTLCLQNPTRILEVHLFHFKRELYGRSLTVRFRKRIRGDQTFASVTELAAQIQRDIAVAKAFGPNEWSSGKPFEPRKDAKNPPELN